jgi:hypothetical protein
MALSGKRFAEDHALASVRGRRMLQPTGVRSALRRRAEWLSERVAMRIEDGRSGYGPEYEELAATLQALELYEARHPPAPKPEAP